MQNRSHAWPCRHMRGGGQKGPSSLVLRFVNGTGRNRFGARAAYTDTSLRLDTLQVLEAATLEIGTEANPAAPRITAEAVCADRPIDLAVDPAQYTHGLHVFGALRMHGAPLSDSLGRLAQEPLAGSAVLAPSTPVSGWTAGDRLVIPDTRRADQTQHSNHRFFIGWGPRRLRFRRGLNHDRI